MQDLLQAESRSACEVGVALVEYAYKWLITEAWSGGKSKVTCLVRWGIMGNGVGVGIRACAYERGGATISVILVGSIVEVISPGASVVSGVSSGAVGKGASRRWTGGASVVSRAGASSRWTGVGMGVCVTEKDILVGFDWYGE